jgi:hypothetical protein
MNGISDTGSIPAFASVEASAIASETTETANRLERALDFASPVLRVINGLVPEGRPNFGPESE